MTTTENSQPTFEGRTLPRPDEPAYDQGLGFDLHTLLDRRSALSLLGLGVASAALAACGSTTAAGGTASASTTGATNKPSTGTTTGATGAGTLTEIPDETAGPYPGDGSNGPDVLAQSGVVRQDITSSFGTSTTKAEGIPMTLELTILDIAAGGSPMAGAAVYVWQCDRAGRYSMYSSGVTTERGPDRRHQRSRAFHQHRPWLLFGPLAAHPLRGLPQPGKHRRLDEGDRHVPGRAAQADVRRGIRDGRL